MTFWAKQSQTGGWGEERGEKVIGGGRNGRKEIMIFKVAKEKKKSERETKKSKMFLGRTVPGMNYLQKGIIDVYYINTGSVPARPGAPPPLSGCHRPPTKRCSLGEARTSWAPTRGHIGKLDHLSTCLDYLYVKKKQR